MENNLIPINTNENGEQLVSGRDLHSFLEIKTPYTIWIERMIDYGMFVEGRDYIKVHNKNENIINSVIGIETIDHIMKIEMAKEISMIQRTEKGKQARQYFINCEKKLKQTKLALPSYQIEDPVRRAKVWITEYEEKKLLAETNIKLIEDNNQLETENKEIKLKKIKQSCSKGGIVRDRNRLRCENEKLKEENKEIKTFIKKYIK